MLHVVSRYGSRSDERIEFAKVQPVLCKASKDLSGENGLFYVKWKNLASFEKDQEVSNSLAVRGHVHAFENLGYGNSRNNEILKTRMYCVAVEETSGYRRSIM